MSLSRPAFVVFALFGLAACGFQPLYGERTDFSIAEKFAEIQIAPFADRVGQQLHNALVAQLYVRGRAETPSYRLDARISEVTASLAVRKSTLATRANLKMTAQYGVQKILDGRQIMTASSTATVSYNILDSEFGTLMAEKNARERAVQQLANDIRSRLAAMFTSGKAL